MYHIEVKNKIRSNYKKLPRNQKKIADFFVENFDRIPFSNVQDISKATDVSVASVVRFSQRIGFTGFSELRDEISSNLQNQLKNNDKFSLIENADLNDDIFTSVANQEIKNINETLKFIERENFKVAVDLIFRADYIYIAGLGISFLLSRILAYQLNQVGIKASHFRHDDTSFLEQALFLKKGDLVIVLSFPPYSKETIDMAKFVYESDIKVISITNKLSAPATFYSNLSLIVKSENMLFTNSLSAISVLINAMATECALRDKKRAKRMLHKSSDIVKDQKLVIY